MSRKVTLAQWDGSPAVLVQDPETGDAEGYVYVGGAWKSGYAEEVMLKAGVMTKEQFEKAFPGVGVPPEAQS